MNKKIIVKLAVSSVMVAVPATGLSDVVASPNAESKQQKLQAKKAFGWAKKAEKLLAEGKIGAAVEFAESAVGAELHNLDYRALLARAYMRDGRFQSAERTLMDVVELGQSDPRTIVSLALSRIAQGKVDSAISLVDANQATLPASDYGLALALAGETKRGVTVLTDAIRADNATARTRQNLALALALDGRWREAQIMAQQDMSQINADQRIIEWAQYARPGAYQTRIAGLLGVTPKEDAGQPVRLALKAVAGEVNMAAVEPAVSAQSDGAAPITQAAVAMAPAASELAPIGPAPVEVASSITDAASTLASIAPSFEAPMVKVADSNIVFVSNPIYAVDFSAQKSAPLIKAPKGPAKAAKPVRVAQSSEASGVKVALADTSEARPQKVSGTHVVQLGAYSSEVGAQKAWSMLKARYNVLNDLRSASSNAIVNGKRFVRLAATGFGDFASANAVCATIKAKGGDCVVKSVGGQAPVRMASAKPERRLASR
jgi:Flp pilus assembly protein TadD